MVFFCDTSSRNDAIDSTVYFKEPFPEIETRKRQVSAPERVADRNVCIKEYFRDGAMKKAGTSTINGGTDRTTYFKEPALEIGPRISRNQLWR